jgi:hypothetical protein
MKIINKKRQADAPSQLTEQDLRKLKVQIEIDGFEAIILHYISYCVVGGVSSAREVFSEKDGSIHHFTRELLSQEFGFNDSMNIRSWVHNNFEVTANEKGRIKFWPKK